MTSSHRRSMWYRRLVMSGVCALSLLVLAGSVWIFQTHRIRVPDTTKAPARHDPQHVAEDEVDAEPQSLPEQPAAPGPSDPPTPDDVDRPAAPAGTVPRSIGSEERASAPATTAASHASPAVAHRSKVKMRTRHHEKAAHHHAAATGHRPHTATPVRHPTPVSHHHVHHPDVTHHATQHGQRPPHSSGPAPGHVHHGGFATPSHHASHTHGVESNHHQSHSMHQQHHRH